MDDELMEIELREGVDINVVFSCKYCHQEGGFAELEQLYEHQEECLFRNVNKKCAMCKHLCIYEEARYPRLEKRYQSEDVLRALGYSGYRKPYCKLRDEFLTEEEFASKHEDCFELEEDENPEVRFTDEYIKWMELSTQVEKDFSGEENVQDNIQVSEEE